MYELYPNKTVKSVTPKRSFNTEDYILVDSLLWLPSPAFSFIPGNFLREP